MPQTDLCVFDADLLSGYGIIEGIRATLTTICLRAHRKMHTPVHILRAANTEMHHNLKKEEERIIVYEKWPNVDMDVHHRVHIYW